MKLSRGNISRRKVLKQWVDSMFISYSISFQRARHIIMAVIYKKLDSNWILGQGDKSKSKVQSITAPLQVIFTYSTYLGQTIALLSNVVIQWKIMWLHPACNYNVMWSQLAPSHHFPQWLCLWEASCRIYKCWSYDCRIVQCYNSGLVAMNPKLWSCNFGNTATAAISRAHCNSPYLVLS